MHMKNIESGRGIATEEARCLIYYLEAQPWKLSPNHLT